MPVIEIEFLDFSDGSIKAVQLETAQGFGTDQHAESPLGFGKTVRVILGKPRSN
jgi:hypothetical protein